MSRVWPAVLLSSIALLIAPTRMMQVWDVQVRLHLEYFSAIISQSIIFKIHILLVWLWKDVSYVCMSIYHTEKTGLAILFFPGTLLMPSLSLLSPHTVFSPGEAVRFRCSVLLRHHLSDFHLYKHGVSTPLVTQRADQSQIGVELTLSDLETFHQGSYSCRYSIKGGFPSRLLSSPPSNSINITVGES